MEILDQMNVDDSDHIDPKIYHSTLRYVHYQIL